MSILINLLPDVRQAKIREHHRRQVFSGVVVGIWAVCGGLLVLMGIIIGGQQIVITGLTRDISSGENKVQAVPGIVDALTAEQHLASLPTLYGQRVYLTKFFNAYTQASPTAVTISSLTISAQNALTVSGSAQDYAAVAKLARAMEASNVTLGSGAAASNEPYFTNVQVTSAGASNSGVSFSINTTLSAGVVSGD